MEVFNVGDRIVHTAKGKSEPGEIIHVRTQKPDNAPDALGVTWYLIQLDNGKPPFEAYYGIEREKK